MRDNAEHLVTGLQASIQRNADIVCVGHELANWGWSRLDPPVWIKCILIALREPTGLI